MTGFLVASMVQMGLSMDKFLGIFKSVNFVLFNLSNSGFVCFFRSDFSLSFREKIKMLYYNLCVTINRIDNIPSRIGRGRTDLELI